MNITLDTETSGLPSGTHFGRFPHYSKLQNYDTARIVSISWIVSKGDKVIQQAYYIIKPDGFVIGKESIAIHGITNEKAHQEGKPFQHVVAEFQPWLELAQNIVAHNIAFDSNVILSEFYRYGREDLIDLMKSKKFICTMKKGKQYMNFHKKPKLSELYEFLYNESMQNAHNAQADTYYCFKCFVKMFPENKDTFFFRNNEVQLTDEQKKIVFENPKVNMMVIACAGSGKSTTTLCRIKYLISQGVPENSIMLTTFTRDASLDMQEKLVDILGYKPACTVSTIDSIARSFYRRYDDGKTELKDVGEFGHEFLRLIRENPDMIARYKYMFIDEFQDINDHQFEIIKEFYKNGAVIFGVGDDSQNIYTFRGSNVKYILNFHQCFVNSKVYKLTYNFRSSPSIVEFANACIEKSNMNIPKQMVSANPIFTKDPNKEWPKPDVNFFMSAKQQASKILESIKLLVMKYQLHDIAILCPINQPLFIVEELLTANGYKCTYLDGKADVRISRKTGHICLSTIHKSKGLEWDAVFLISMSDDLIPKVKNDTSVEEERRVFYVGCTRAKKELFIYFTKSFSDVSYVSRYVSEIPKELYSFTNVRDPTPFFGKSDNDITVLNKSVSKLVDLLDGADYIYLKKHNILPVLDVQDIKKTKFYEATTYNGIVKDEDIYHDFGIFVDTFITREASIRFNIVNCRKDKYTLRTLASVVLDPLHFKIYKIYKSNFDDNIKYLNYLVDGPASELQRFVKIQEILERNNLKIHGPQLFNVMHIILCIVENAKKFQMRLEDIPVFNESFLPEDFEEQMQQSLDNYADATKPYQQIIDSIWNVSKCQMIVNERRRRLLFKKITGNDLIRDFSTMFENIQIFLHYIAAKNQQVNCRLDLKLDEGVYGEVDMIVGDTLIDYKTSSSDEVEAKWIVQLLCYKILCERNSEKRFPIRKIAIFNPLRGWISEINIDNWDKHMDLLVYLLKKREEQIRRNMQC